MALAFAYDGVALSFDFEEYVHSLLPPLYGGRDGRPDPRHRTIVCRHWLKSLCQKGDLCEYLHQMDLDKMPICKWGTACQARPNCLYRHIDDEERPECIYYKQGFCRHGPGCRFKHIKLTSEECPEEADFSLVQRSGDPNSAQRKTEEVPEHNHADPTGGPSSGENFKVNICRQWFDTRSCVEGDKCRYAHGSHELRHRQYKPYPVPAGDFSGPPRRPYPGRVGGKRPYGAAEQLTAQEVQELETKLPGVLHLSSARYFIVKSPNFESLVTSAAHGIWSVRRSHTPILNAAFASGAPVVLLFTVLRSKQFQGYALMVGDIDEEELGGDWTLPFKVQWHQLCELPFTYISSLTNPLDDNIQVIRTRDGQEVPHELGKLLLMHMHRADSVDLPETDISQVLAMENADALDNEDEGPQFPVPKDKPGYLFVTGGGHLSVSLQKLIFGMPDHQAVAARSLITVGHICFLLDITRGLLFGIFEILSPLTDRIDPKFCADGSKDTPFPAQIRVRSLLEVPPIHDSDPQLVEIMPSRIKQGPLNRDQVKRLATLLAGRGGKLMQLPNIGSLPPKNDRIRKISDADWYTPSAHHSEKVYIELSDTDDLKISEQIIGRDGENLSQISDSFNGEVALKLRGKRSGFLEGPNRTESPDPLHIVVSSDSEYKMRAAIQELHALLKKIKTDYAKRQRADFDKKEGERSPKNSKSESKTKRHRTTDT